jgi:hypothetical protein
MENQKDSGLHANQKTQGVWERKTGDRRLGQNQLFGSFRVNPGVRVLSQSDPTDEALAAIASILHKPADTPVENPTGNPVDQPEIPSSEEAAVAAEPSQPSEPPQSVAADGDTYVKFGPGPLDAVRFKWTARPAGDGSYFVDETIGNNSRVMTSRPMPKEQAIRVVDERERDARRRFDALKNEMTGQGSAATRPARASTGDT